MSFFTLVSCHFDFHSTASKSKQNPNFANDYWKTLHDCLPEFRCADKVQNSSISFFRENFQYRSSVISELFLANLNFLNQFLYYVLKVWPENGPYSSTRQSGNTTLCTINCWLKSDVFWEGFWQLNMKNSLFLIFWFFSTFSLLAQLLTKTRKMLKQCKKEAPTFCPLFYITKFRMKF